MSDLHGDFSHFKKMLKMINFDFDTDDLYILGDVIDRGKENLSMLDYVRNNSRMHLIKGNHELFAQMYIEGIIDKRQWTAWGGGPTSDEVDALTEMEKADLSEYISNLEYYFEIDVNGEKWILTHSGLSADCIVESDGQVCIAESILKAVNYNEFNYLVSHDIHYMPYSVTRGLNSFMVVGHTPVLRLNDDGSYKILHRDRYMCIDSGAGHRKYGGKMSCYCIETKEEFYI